MTLFSAHPLARAVDVVEHGLELLAELAVVRELGRHASGRDVLPDLVASLRAMSDRGSQIGTQALVTRDFVQVRDGLAYRILHLVHLAPSLDAKHSHPGASGYRVEQGTETVLTTRALTAS